MIKLKQNKIGCWCVPGLIELEAVTGKVVLDHTFFPNAAEQIFYGRGLGAKHLANALTQFTSGSLVVVGASSSKTPKIKAVLDSISQKYPNAHIYPVPGHANHQAIRGGIEALHKSQASQVIVIGGGTTLDVGKAIACLAQQDGELEITAFQTGKKTVNPERTLPWVALPTTSGTGSESTNNAVIELGAEKRSIRNIPPPSLIIVDPSFTDSLPLSSTIISLVDALAQSLEVITHAKASPEVQAIALAAFLNLAQGVKAVIRASARIRDVLSWGSLLMGIAFAHAGLGLPHALVHFCNKFGLSHGHMVGIMLVPGLQVQAAKNFPTALRLGRIVPTLTSSAKEDTMSINFDDESAAPSNLELHQLWTWLEKAITNLFNQVSLETSLQEAGLSPADLDWIAAQEYASGASFAIPQRRATADELRTVLQKAWSK